MTSALRVFFLGCKTAQIAGTTWSAQLMNHIKHERVHTLEEADVIVTTDLTTNSKATNEEVLNKFLRATKGKPLVVFLHDDPDEEMTLDDYKLHEEQPNALLVYRTSLCKSLRQSYERVLPSFQPNDQQIQMLPPAACDPVWKPSVGFCGVIKWDARKTSCAALRGQPDRFTTQFVFRHEFHNKWDDATRAKHKQEFEDILRNCPYQLCSRGAGNFSHRFYEVLAAGRIPVLIDTDTLLPTHVPKAMYDRCVILVKDAKALPDALWDFHSRHDPVVSQALCRALWETYFSVAAFAPVVETSMKALLAQPIDKV